MLWAANTCAEALVSIVFEFPDRQPVRVNVSIDEAAQLTGQKLPYMIEFLTRAALLKAGLKYEVLETDGQRSITSIDSIPSDTQREWVCFVNGIRSPFHINTQSTENVRSIRFVLESKGDRTQQP